MSAMEICHLFISRGHNFVGHHGREPDTHPMIETSEIECVAGRGIRGDRYFDFKDDYKGQITFFSLEIFDKLCSALQLQDCSPAAARRNVITRGVDLNELIGQEFKLQGLRFLGTEECRPCRNWNAPTPVFARWLRCRARSQFRRSIRSARRSNTRDGCPDWCRASRSVALRSRNMDMAQTRVGWKLAPNATAITTF